MSDRELRRSVDAPGRPGRSVALVVGLGALLQLRQVAYLADPDNRYAVHWQRADALALVAAMLLGTLVVAAVYALLTALPRLRAPFLVWLTGSAALSLATFFELPPGAERGGALAVFGLAVASAFVANRAVHGALLRAGVVLLPVALVTYLQVLLWAPWGDVLDSLEAPAPAAGIAPDAPPLVLLVIFDGWSYEQSFRDGRPREFLPHLRRFASRSITFQRAVSPDWETAYSLPGLLFGRETGHEDGWVIAPGNGRAEWRHGEAREPLGPSPLFAAFAEAGYRTGLVGFYLPYRRLLGPEAQRVRTEPHVPRGWSFRERLQVRALAGARFLVGPWSRERLRGAYRRRYSENWHALNQRVRDDVLQILATWPAPAFLVAHWPTPHPPFVLSADGSYRGPYRRSRREGGVTDYQRHLRHMDGIVGQLVAALERDGRFDDALVILTSDHGWKQRDQRILHVPLLVKWPGRREPGSFEPVFPTRALAGALAPVARGAPDLDAFARYVVAHAIAVIPETRVPAADDPS